MEYVKLLTQAGRYGDAHGFGEDYKLRCGKDGAITKWSDFAKKKLDRLSQR